MPILPQNRSEITDKSHKLLIYSLGAVLEDQPKLRAKIAGVIK